jgi:hypothetical protein
MRFFNRRDNPNTIVGLFLLILLAVFAGPNTLPRLLSSAVPFVDEGIPCDWLRQGEDRAAHQSLIGRIVSSETDPPLSLEVRTSSISGDPSQSFTITVVVINDTLGTIPFLLTPDTLILDPNQPSNGLGVAFSSPAPISNQGENVASYAESRIRLLGPRQRCVHKVSYVVSQLPNPSVVGFSGATIKALYRNTAVGSAAVTTGEPVIYSDQGLWVGVVESPPADISIAAQ